MFRSDQTIIQWAEIGTKGHKIAFILPIQIHLPDNIYKNYIKVFYKTDWFHLMILTHRRQKSVFYKRQKLYLTSKSRLL
jgi:hypothetical protein